MSKINLPELPPEVDTVRALFRGQPDHFEAQDYYYTQEQMRDYAEQAVRQALAEQEPVAWKYQTNGTHVWLIGVEPPDDAYDAFTLQRLAIIPEKDHG